MSQPRVVTLDRKKHADLHYRALEDYSFAMSMTTMPLLPHEAPEAARCFPIIFPDSRSAVPHALLGLGGKNIFVDERGRWTAPYLPLMAANHPFSLSLVPGGEQPGAPEVALAMEEDAPHFRQPDGEALYSPDGEPTETLKRIVAVMGNQYRLYRESERGLAELNLSGALLERVASVREGGRERSVGGLRMADRERVMALPDDTLGRWAKNGVLEMLFFHWQSMRNLKTLLDDPSCPKGARNGVE